MVVGVLGILKAGAAYVPLDPGYPEERLSLMIEDAGMPVLVTVEQTRQQLSLPAALRTVCLDRDWEEIFEESPETLATRVTSENLAYVIYTSGSTGRPKGVMVQHRNVVNFFTAMDSILGEPPTGVWLAVTSLSFDISVLELLWTLARGFKVVLRSESQGGPDFAKASSRTPKASPFVESGRMSPPMQFSLAYLPTTALPPPPIATNS